MKIYSTLSRLFLFLENIWRGFFLSKYEYFFLDVTLLISFHFSIQEQYFDTKSGKGFIEHRLWNARKSLPVDKKKYSTSKVKAILKKGQCEVNENDKHLLNEEELEEQVYLFSDNYLLLDSRN